MLNARHRSSEFHVSLDSGWADVDDVQMSHSSLRHIEAVGLGRLGRSLGILVACLTLATPGVGAANPIAVATSFDCPDYRPSVTLVDVLSGLRTVLFGPDGERPDCAFVGTGAIPEHIYSMGVDASGQLLLTDSDVTESRLLRIDITTSTSTVISGCSVAASVSAGQVCGGPIVGSGALGTLLGGIVVVPEVLAGYPGLAPGEIILATSRYSPCMQVGYALLRIDPQTGNRVTLSGLDENCSTVVGSGDPFSRINGIRLLGDGRLLVADGDNENGIGRLIAVDPLSGHRSVLSGCSVTAGDFCIGPVVGTGPIPDYVRDLVLLNGFPTRVLAHADFGEYCGAGESGGLIVFDIESGARTMLSGRDDTCALFGAGPHLKDLEGVTLASNGMLVVSEDSLGRLIEVDPSSGDRRVVSGCSDVDSSLNCIEPILGGGPIPQNHGSLTSLPEPGVGSTVFLGAFCVVLAHLASRRRDRLAEIS